MNKLMALVILLIPFGLLAQRNIQFTAENIDFNLTGDRFSINGIYYFYNNTDSPSSQSILFPFSNKADSLIVKRVFDLSRTKSLNYKLCNSAITFTFFAPSRDTVKINIAYSQKTSNENVYILESAQTWGEPIKNAKYALTIDSSVVIKQLTPKPDTLINRVYHWNKTNFSPNENFKVIIEM